MVPRANSLRGLRPWLFLAAAVLLPGAWLMTPRPIRGQDAPAAVAPADQAAEGSPEKPPVSTAKPGEDARMEAAAKQAEEAFAKADAEKAKNAEQSKTNIASQINWLDMMFAGGPLMYPIAAVSLVALMFGIERLLGLRRRKVIPPALIHGLGQLAGRQGGLDPRLAYRLCQQHPSTAASVIRAMLLKIGRPHSEVENAVTEASQREAAKLYNNVRPLNLAVTVAPMLGLLGTVQGMIQSFFVTAHLPPGENKAMNLAEGIYIALVTTFAGLCVAIPAAILAHYFEGRIQRLFHEIDETLFGLLPQLERYEGKLRVSRQQLSSADGGALAADRRETDAPVEKRQPARASE
ncbi:MAG: MotA/TolQ/ExbB proton channel family protein [Pirellulales bacterium]